MAGQPPAGDPAPADGSLPEPALDRLGAVPFGIYVHVPFCQTRCGYCDFNTYTATELGARRLPRVVRGAGHRRDQARGEGAGRPRRAGADGLLRRRHADPAAAGRSDGHPARRSTVSSGLADGAEVTAEANPETVDERVLAQLRAGGFTRISLGMQSAVPHVLAVLDRVHQPGRPEQCVRLGARGRVRPGQPRPHLRHAGRERRGLGALARPRARRPARTTSPPTR